MSKREGPGYIYCMAHAGLIKIGYSGDPDDRLIMFRPHYPGIVLTHVIATNAMCYLERLLHWQLRDYHVEDAEHAGEEWFKLPDVEIVRLCAIKRYHLKPEIIQSLAAKHTRPVLPWRQARARYAMSYNWGRGGPQRREGPAHE